jgi:hypothetical protein
MQAMRPGIEEKSFFFQGDAIAPDPVPGLVNGEGDSLFSGVIAHCQAGRTPSQDGDVRGFTHKTEKAIKSDPSSFVCGIFCSLPIHLSRQKRNVSRQWRDRRFLKEPDKSGNYKAF